MSVPSYLCFVVTGDGIFSFSLIPFLPSLIMAVHYDLLSCPEVSFLRQLHELQLTKAKKGLLVFGESVLNYKSSV